MKKTLAALALAAFGAVSAAPAIAQFVSFNYASQVQWGGPNTPWIPNGIFVVPAPTAYPMLNDSTGVAHFSVLSNDGGKTLVGKISYQGGGPVDFRATNTTGNAYDGEIRIGGASAEWRKAGTFVLGGRDWRVTQLNVVSQDAGKTLAGTIAYGNDRTLGFKATRQ